MAACHADPINECEDNPCGSDVICVDKLIGYECQCAKGYSYDRSNKRCQGIVTLRNLIDNDNYVGVVTCCISDYPYH